MARSQTELKKYLRYGEYANADTPLDESSLEDQALQERLQGFQELSQVKGEISPTEFSQEIESKLKAYGISNNTGAISKAISDFTISQGRFPNPRELQSIAQSRATAKDRSKIDNFANSQDIQNQFISSVSSQITPPDLTNDIKRVKDLIGERGRLAKGNQDIQSFLGELPKTLASQTDQFLGTQQANAETHLRDFLDPQIRQSLAARGLLTSGDLSAELAGAGEQLQGQLNQQRADLQAQDAAFFENAAYQVNLKKVLDANQNLAQEVNFQRGNALNQQENRFQVSQQNQADQFGLDAFRRQQDQSLNAQNIRLRQQQDIAKSQSLASTIGNIGRYGGLIAGAALAAPSGGLSLAAGAGLGYAGGGVLSDFYTADSFRKTGK